MASTRPSEYAMQYRTDGGPFIRVEQLDKQGNLVPARSDNADRSNVYYSDVAQPSASGNGWVLIMAVTAELLTFYPRIPRSGNSQYGEPKYGTIEKIELTYPVDEPYTLPHDEGSLEELLGGMPDGLLRDWRYGLGFHYEYRFIPNTIGQLPGVDTLLLHGGRSYNKASVKGNVYCIGLGVFDELRKKIDRLTNRYQRESRADRDLVCYTGLLHKIAPDLYPKRSRQLSPDLLKELIGDGHTRLSKNTRQAATRLVKDNVASISRSEPQALFNLKAEIELVTLEQLLEEFRRMMDGRFNEDRWQQFFATNAFILDMAFGYPVKMLVDRPYVGGKKITGRGGQHSDFLMAARATGNLALIEIKHPQQDLLAKQAYRGNVYGPSNELAGSIAQALSQRANLQQEKGLTDELAEPAHGYAINVVVIIGQTPEDPHRQRSFEQYRNSLKDVQIVTFDELETRLTCIHQALKPPPSPAAQEVEDPF